MDWVRERLRHFSPEPIAADGSGSVTYGDFAGRIDGWKPVLRRWGIASGDRVGLLADYHLEVVALLLALMETGCIVIPLSEEDRSMHKERLDTACATKLITAADRERVAPDTVTCADWKREKDGLHPLMEDLIARNGSGFVIYTSGSTGKGKGVLLEYGRVIRKHRDKIRKASRTLLFLKLDHIGGLNTLFSVILNGGTIVTSPTRQAEDICRTVEKHRVELLPTTPSFLTMLLMSGMYDGFDLSSLKTITYGTEVMPASTLAGINRRLPAVTLKQTYGLSELGILSTQSKDSQSNWMKIGGLGFEVRIREDILWIKSDQAMLGYLNAPSPFDAEGWYNTGDKVQVDGEYVRILGRESEIINVAGEKVFPTEIESYLLTLENIRDAVVRGKRNPITGHVVWAEVILNREEDAAAMRRRVTEQCQKHFPAFKVPRLITIADHADFVGSRFKKIRMSKVAAFEHQGAPHK